MSNRTADLDLTGATEAFCARLSAEGRSPATIAAYRRDLALVARVADELAPGIVCRTVTAGLLDQVFSAGAVTESERGPRSAASLHRMKAAVRAFFAWASEAGVVDDNPARSIRMHRLPRKLPVFLTTAEKKRLLKELKGRTDFSALRDRAMIEVLLGTGIRLGELAALDMDDIDLDAKHLRVRAKGNVPQVKFIKTDLRTLLRRYLGRAPSTRPPGNGSPVPVEPGRQTLPAADSQPARPLAAEGRDRKGTDAARLRHTFATHLYGATNDLLVVQRALGHRDVSTTQIYTHLVDGQLEEALERL